MQLLHWKTQWIPSQIYALIVGLKVKELLTVFLRIDTRLHQESTEKGEDLLIKNVVVNDRGGRGNWNVALKFWSISIIWLSDMWLKENHVCSIF